MHQRDFSGFKSVLISDEEFRKCHMFQQFQAHRSHHLHSLLLWRSQVALLRVSLLELLILGSYTGAFDHITESKGISHDLSSPLSLLIVTLANGTTSCVESIGTAKVTALLSLSSVFYILKFSFNLLSISKLTRSLNIPVIFFPHHYVF